MANPFLGLLIALGLAAPMPQTETHQCYAAKIDIDGYLFDKYLDTPKRDTTSEFTSKDPKAAALLGMTLRQYVIGGMDRDFKQTLFFALKAMDEAGLNPGITSAFRDDYRQQLITEGVRSKVGYSYHGGSTRGGYGHGMAVDLVSLNGDTRAQQSVFSEKLWLWIDVNGKKYGIARPYHDHDPPHVAPVTSAEYAARQERPLGHTHKHGTQLATRHKYHLRHFAGKKGHTSRG
jgi:hypothetical protein